MISNQCNLSNMCRIFVALTDSFCKIMGIILSGNQDISPFYQFSIRDLYV